MLLMILKRTLTSVLFAGLLVFVHLPGGSAQTFLNSVQVQTTAKPQPAPARWRPLIGEYVLDNETIIVLESDGQLGVLFKRKELAPLREVSNNNFAFVPGANRAGEQVVFSRDSRGRVTQVALVPAVYKRKPLGPEEGANQLKIQPLRPVPELIKEALTAKPPVETGDFLPPDLVELTKLDPTIKLEIRYATTNNLFGTVFYSQARAFMQRAAAEALVRANAKLKASGCGVLVDDGDRRWY